MPAVALNHNFVLHHDDNPFDHFSTPSYFDLQSEVDGLAQRQNYALNAFVSISIPF
jgi:hypothetical protein